MASYHNRSDEEIEAEIRKLKEEIE